MGETVRLKARDVDALAWINAQYGVREDRLAGVLNRSYATTRRWAREMSDAGYVERRQLLGGEPAWIWLTTRGARMTPARLRPWEPNVGRLRHIGAVADVRLYLAKRAPDLAWVSERELYRARQGHEHVPDAVVQRVEGDQVREYALEIELTQKARYRTTRIIEELLARYDQAVYYAAPGGPERSLLALSGELGADRVDVRPLSAAQGWADGAYGKASRPAVNVPAVVGKVA